MGVLLTPVHGMLLTQPGSSHAGGAWRLARPVGMDAPLKARGGLFKAFCRTFSTEKFREFVQKVEKGDTIAMLVCPRLCSTMAEVR
jgi:hypothetical protein